MTEVKVNYIYLRLERVDRNGWDSRRMCKRTKNEGGVPS